MKLQVSLKYEMSINYHSVDSWPLKVFHGDLPLVLGDGEGVPVVVGLCDFFLRDQDLEPSAEAQDNGVSY